MGKTGFKRVLLAIDGSQESEAAANAVIALTKPGLKVHVTHVWNLEVHHQQGHWDIEMREEAERLVEGVAARLRAVGAEVEGEVRRGSEKEVAQVLGGVAQEMDADLIVMGGRGLSNWQALRERSVSHKLLSATKIPVLVVRGWSAADEVEVRRILLAVAGGDDVKIGVDAVVALTQAMEARVMVVHVAQAIISVQGYAFIEEEEEIKATLADTLKQLKAKGVEAECMTVHATVGSATGTGHAVAQVAEEWKADVVVMSGSRTGDLESLLLGSATKELLHESHHGVLVAERG